MLQNYEGKSTEIRRRFLDLKRTRPDALAHRIAFSWSNWGFGMEDLTISLRRLAASGIEYVELHGNHYGHSLGYRLPSTKAALADAGVRVSGICGMFSKDIDLSSNRPVVRQRAVDYIRRELDFGKEIGARYLLVVPAAVGRPVAIDACELERSVETLRIVAEDFVASGIVGAVEPIRSAEVSIVHTVADALGYIRAVGSPGIAGINGDVYHMQSEEPHIGEAIVQAGGNLVNLHLADSNRSALGDGSMDLDTIIMALYLIGFNRDGCYATPEPLGPGGDPYPAMYGIPNAPALDDLVAKSAQYFRVREDYVRALV